MFSRRVWFICGLLSALLLAGCATSTGRADALTATAHPSQTPTQTPSSTPARQPTTLYLGVGQTVYALDLRTGVKRWVYQTGQAESSSGGCYTCRVGAVTAAGSAVYFLNPADNSIYALSSADGSLLWKASGVQGADSGGYITIASGVVIASSSSEQVLNTTTAFDPSTGKKLWTQPLGATALLAGDGVIYETRVLPSSDITPVTDGTLKALNPSTGAVLWQATGHAYGSLALVGNTLYANADDALHAFDAQTGAQVWARSFQASASTSVLMWQQGTTIYISNGSDLYALDGATHAVLWQISSAGIFGGVAVVHGVFCRSGFKDMYGYDTSTGTQKWHIQRSSGYAAIVTDGDLCVATGYHPSETPIVAVDAQTGAIRWSYTASVSSVRMLASGGDVYVLGSTSTQSTTTDSVLSAVSETDGSVQWTLDTQDSSEGSMALG